MEAPRLRSFIRNVRTEPRRFSYRSHLVADTRPEWDERKRRIEEEVLREQGASGELRESLPPPVRIRSRSGRLASDGTFRSRREQRMRANRYALLRALLIILGLIWLGIKGLQWVDATDFGGMLNGLRK
jgi:hypothetical protein